MAPIAGTVRVQERIRLLAWQDDLLDRPIFAFLVFDGEAADLAALATRLPLGDVLDAVRQAHAKLPPLATAPDGSEETAAEGAEGPDEGFALPPGLARMRFVLPVELENAVNGNALTGSGYGALRVLLTGRGEGGPFTKLGLLGRAATEERGATGDHPFVLATLLQSIRFVSDALHRRLVDPGKVRDAVEAFRLELMTWTTRLAPGARRAAIVARLLRNPLAPFALRRTIPPAAAGEAAALVLEKPNAWGLTAELVRALDAHFHAPLTDLLDLPGALEAAHARVQEILDAWHAMDLFRAAETAARRRFFRAAGLIVVVGAGAMLGVPPYDAWPTHLGLGAGAGLTVAVALGLAGTIQLGWRRLTAQACRHERRLARALKREAGFRKFFPRGDWKARVPATAAAWLKCRCDCVDAHALAALPLPPLDGASLYSPAELDDKWAQNACVCYGDDFRTLIRGAAKVAAVYFIDVAGSTEISTRETLSNALELYSRVLKRANEEGLEPTWRKEMGDGRIYCHPVPEALRRAILSVQGAAHPKVGLAIGVGLSAGEIYRDVTTGDFLNEATNRASRLNGRDDAAGAYVKARYTRTPHRVHVKWGRLSNAGIALDEAALAALGLEVPPAAPPMPVVEWRYPGHGGSTIAIFTERVAPSLAIERLAVLADDRATARWQAAHGSAEVYEIFVHASAADVGEGTPLAGADPAEWLAHHAAHGVTLATRTVDHDEPVRRLAVTLPTGETVWLAVKRERARLKGLGDAVVAGVEVPPVLLDDTGTGLKGFLASL